MHETTKRPNCAADVLRAGRMWLALWVSIVAAPALGQATANDAHRPRPELPQPVDPCCGLRLRSDADPALRLAHGTLLHLRPSENSTLSLRLRRGRIALVLRAEF